jgi:hypothetical protein
MLILRGAGVWDKSAGGGAFQTAKEVREEHVVQQYRMCTAVKSKCASYLFCFGYDMLHIVTLPLMLCSCERLPCNAFILLILAIAPQQHSEKTQKSTCGAASGLQFDR